MPIRPKPGNNLMGIICSLIDRMVLQVLKKILAKQTAVTPKDKFAI